MSKYIYCVRKRGSAPSVDYFTPGKKYEIYKDGHDTYVNTPLGRVTLSKPNMNTLLSWYELKEYSTEFNSLLQVEE